MLANTPVIPAFSYTAIFETCKYFPMLLKTLLLGEENRRLKRNWPIDLI
jgi:hypothetical protein